MQDVLLRTMDRQRLVGAEARRAPGRKISNAIYARLQADARQAEEGH